MTIPSDPDAHHIGTFWALDLTCTLPPAVAPRVPITFRRAGAEDLPELMQVMGLSDQKEILHRFAAGKHCYIGRIDGKLATYGWVTFDKEDIGELGLSVRLQPGEAYIWDCATLPAYRGQRLYPALLSSMLSDLRNRGLHRIWIGADADNIPSQRGMILAGFHPVADILHVQHAGSSRPYSLRLRSCAGAADQEIEDIHATIFGEMREL